MIPTPVPPLAIRDALEAAKTNTHLHLRTQTGCLAFDMALQGTARHADELIAQKVGETHLTIPDQRMLPGGYANKAVDREGPQDQIIRLDRTCNAPGIPD